MSRRDSFYESESRPQRWVKLLGAGIVALAMLALAKFAWSGLAADEGAGPPPTIDAAVSDVLDENAVDRTAVRAKPSNDPNDPAVIKVPVPDDATLSRLNADLSEAVREAGGSVFDAVEEGRRPERPRSVKLKVGTDGNVTHEIHLQPESTEKGDGPARLALVFDDLGWSMGESVRALLELPPPLTFAVIPGLSHSATFVAEATARGHEIILHLPMEPMDSRHDPGQGAILVDLPAEENQRRIRAFLGALPNYVGISNHMGSRATASDELMDLLLGELKAHDRSLFFFDSKTSPYSVVRTRARKAGVGTISNNLFLDADSASRAKIDARAERVGRLATRRGSAVAIGHVRRDTIAAVREALPRWRERGIELVALSDLVHR